MSESAHDLVRRLHREAIERIRNEPPGTIQEEPVQVEFPNVEPGDPFAEEWALYRSEVVGLLRNGHRGRVALVRAGQPITTWESVRDALQALQLIPGPDKFLLLVVETRTRYALRLGSRARCRV
jgi:hypothetical protein